MVLHSHAPEWSYDDTKRFLLSIPDRGLRDFSCIAYLVGGRLNEVRHLMPKDVTMVKTKDGEDRIIVSLFTEKNLHVERRPVPVNPVAEKEYADILLEWKNTFDEKSEPFQDINERTIRRHLKKYLDIHPHALRHLRVHHVDDKEIPNMKGLTPRQFKDLFGWSLISTSAHYQSRTRGKDLSELF